MGRVRVVYDEAVTTSSESTVAVNLHSELSSGFFHSGPGSARASPSAGYDAEAEAGFLFEDYHHKRSSSALSCVETASTCSSSHTSSSHRKSIGAFLENAYDPTEVVMDSSLSCKPTATATTAPTVTTATNSGITSLPSGSSKLTALSSQMYSGTSMNVVYDSQPDSQHAYPMVSHTKTVKTHNPYSMAEPVVVLFHCECNDCKFKEDVAKLEAAPTAVTPAEKYNAASVQAQNIAKNVAALSSKTTVEQPKKKVNNAAGNDNTFLMGMVSEADFIEATMKFAHENQKKDVPHSCAETPSVGPSGDDEIPSSCEVLNVRTDSQTPSSMIFSSSTEVTTSPMVTATTTPIHSAPSSKTRRAPQPQELPHTFATMPQAHHLHQQQQQTTEMLTPLERDYLALAATIRTPQLPLEWSVFIPPPPPRADTAPIISFGGAAKSEEVIAAVIRRWYSKVSVVQVYFVDDVSKDGCPVPFSDVMGIAEWCDAASQWWKHTFGHLQKKPMAATPMQPRTRGAYPRQLCQSQWNYPNVPLQQSQQQFHYPQPQHYPQEPQFNHHNTARPPQQQRPKFNCHQQAPHYQQQQQQPQQPQIEVHYPSQSPIHEGFW